MSLESLRSKVEQLIEKAQSGESGGANLPLVGSEITDWFQACMGPLFDEYWETRALLGLLVRYLDVSNGTIFTEMFYQNDIVTEISFDHTSTSKGTDFDSMFYKCTSLETISGLDCSSVTDNHGVSKMLRYCTALKNLYNIIFSPYNALTTTSYRPFYDCTALENITVKGTIRLKSNLYFNTNESLTADSIMNILNALENHSDETKTYEICFGSTNLAKLTDEQKQVAYDKNINLS